MMDRGLPRPGPPDRARRRRRRRRDEDRLSDNPRLTLVGPGAFDGLDGLEALVLPSGVKHLAPEALESLPALRDVSLAATGDGVTRNFVDASSTARFDDVCCRREASPRAGVYFCDVSPDEPGVVDAIYEETNTDNIYVGLFDHMQTLDYRNLPTALNKAQIEHEPDGCYRIIISHQDPGLPNWLCTDGHQRGSIFWRFLLPETDPPKPECTVVRLIELG